MTIYDIAKEANVSVSTVSRVINGRKNIKEETRALVQAILDKNSYVPNEVARGLANKSTKIIGIMNSDIRNPHHNATAFTIEQELSKLGYSAMLCNTGENDEKKSHYIKMFSKRQVDGVIFIGSIFENEFIKEQILAHLKQVPIVIVNGFIDLPNVYGVLVDEEAGIASCVDIMVSRGRKNIAFVKDATTVSAHKKESGYKKGMERNGLKNLIIGHTDNSFSGGYAIAVELIKKHPQIDGMVFSEDITAVGAMRAIFDVGLKCPRDVSVTGLNNSVFSEISYPKLTSVDNKLAQTGQAAATILTQVLAGNEQPSKKVFFSDVIVRESL